MAKLHPPFTPPSLNTRVVHAYLRCCFCCSSDTRKKKRRLLLVRNSWRRLLSVRSGMSNSSFSVGEAESWAVLTRSWGPVSWRSRPHSHTCALVNSLTCQLVPEVGQADLLGAVEEQGALWIEGPHLRQQAQRSGHAPTPVLPQGSGGPSPS